MNQNPTQNQNQQPSDGGKHDDDVALTDFLASLMDYTPTVKPYFPILFFPSNSDQIEIEILTFSAFRYPTSSWSITWPRAASSAPTFDCRYLFQFQILGRFAICSVEISVAVRVVRLII